MSAKWKIALLAMLGLSTAACCSTKKAKKSEDPKSADVDNVTEDPRVMLMYGVPFPEGEIARPVTDEDLERVKKEAAEQGARFEDGSVVKPLTDEEAQRRLEEVKAEIAAKEE
ncbi:MAG: hypothetical protein J6V26_05890 [Alistipes sp.]|jgi:hypothetical protein|nr:hypothetical protein [Alistipes sp.]